MDAQNSFSGATPLHCAAQENDRGDKEGRLLAIKMLLAAGANPNLQVCSKIHEALLLGRQDLCHPAGPSTRTMRDTCVCA